MSNGLFSETRQYNSRLQPTQIQLGSLFTIVNRYDPNSGSDVDCGGVSPAAVAGNNGNVLAQTVNGVGRLYSYDAVNRLCRAAQNSTWSQTYGYDPRGNLATSGTGQVPAATVEAIGGIGAYGPTNRVSTWAYDQAGNLTGIPATAGSTVRATCAANTMPGVAMLRTACYDAENRMTAETDANGATATYTYDGDGRRVNKTVNGVTTTFIYDPLGQLAQDYDGPAIPASEAGTRYVTTDQVGSTRLLTKADGTMAQTYDYLPFGQEFVPSTDTNRIRFTSKERDAETGLDNFLARYYSGPQGRFTSADEPFAGQDPSDPQSWNLFSYGRNNPLRYTDPSGTTTCDENGDNCRDDVTVTAKAPKVNTTSSPIGPFIINVLVTTAQVAQKTQELIQPVADWLSQPRNPTCTAGYSALGASVGFYAGGGLGSLGLAGGPAAAATIPGGAAAGTALGGAIGGVGGLVLCSTGSGSGGGGGGGGSKRPKSGLSGKEAASDVPSWAKGQRPLTGELGKTFAERLLGEKYGPGNYPKGPGSEFNKIQKWGDRAFE